jgi:large subunit ribosomal protein L18
VQAAIAKLASGQDKAQAEAKSSSKSVLAARAVGIVLAERTKAAKVAQVVFDRNGFLFAGRVKALADGAREGGLNF